MACLDKNIHEYLVTSGPDVKSNIQLLVKQFRIFAKRCGVCFFISTPYEARRIGHTTPGRPSVKPEAILFGMIVCITARS